MAKNEANIHIYGGLDGAVYTGAKGSTLPVDMSAPAAPMAEVGWLSDAGVKLEQKADTQKFYGWQGGTLVKVSVSKTERTFTFECIEETALTMGLVYPGTTFTKSGTAPNEIAKGTVKGGIVGVTRAWTIDTQDDEGYMKRYNVPTGTVDPSNSVEHKFDAITVYTVVVNVIGDFDILSNNPAFVASISA